MNLYEHTIVARQDISTTQLKQITEKYSNIVTKNKGEIVQTQNWGLLNLAYMINKNKKGNYIHFKIKGSTNIILDLEKNERMDKNLLRYMTVKVKDFDLETNYFSKNDDTDLSENLQKKVRKDAKEKK
tara:strand:- start:111 stop:494 length:384 start_codon:yes stop_codon:yes gene_type:complete